MINYRELLKKYIEHVGNCEGVTYVTDDHRNDPFHSSSELFTDEEWDELNELDYEVMKKCNPKTYQ